MYAIKLKATVPENRRLVIELPADEPTGEVEPTIEAQPAASADVQPAVVNPERERIRAKLLAAGFLVTGYEVPQNFVPLSPEELLKVGTLPPGARPSEELINEDRGEW